MREGKGRNGRCKGLIARAHRTAYRKRGRCILQPHVILLQIPLTPLFFDRWSMDGRVRISFDRPLRYQKVVIGVPFRRVSNSS